MPIAFAHFRRRKRAGFRQKNWVVCDRENFECSTVKSSWPVTTSPRQVRWSWGKCGPQGTATVGLRCTKAWMSALPQIDRRFLPTDCLFAFVCVQNHGQRIRVAWGNHFSRAQSLRSPICST
jgi:hypothetical protein